MSFLDGIKIQQKSLFLHNFSWDLSLFLLEKNQGSLSSKNQLCVLMSFLLIMHIVFHHKIMSGFFFFLFGTIIRIIWYYQLELIFEI